MFFETQVNINSDFSSVSLQEHCQECLVYTKYFCTNYDSSSASDNAMQIDNIDVVIFNPQTYPCLFFWREDVNVDVRNFQLCIKL